MLYGIYASNSATGEDEIRTRATCRATTWRKILDQEQKNYTIKIVPLNKQLIEQNIIGNERQKKIEEYEIEALRATKFKG